MIALLASMRFAISLLGIIAIASVIGTVLPQHQPTTVYLNQFGLFWCEVFDTLGLYTVYSSAWFLSIMTFLVVSTTLCIVRNTPKMLKEVRHWQDNMREQSLRHFRHHTQWQTLLPPVELALRLKAHISSLGYSTKIVEKKPAILLIGKRGAAAKWGYLLAHSAIVFICLGGLVDSDIFLRIAQWQGKTPFTGSGLIRDIAKQHRLNLNHPSFRGNTVISEGGASNVTLLAYQQGMMVQPLPFTLHLKKFVIEYYSTGMPKLFASQVIVRDDADGTTFPATIKVNAPLVYKGVAVYQSSFEDGGSTVQVRVHPMTGHRDTARDLMGQVGSRTLLDQDYVIEWVGFRALNIENMANVGQDVRAVAKPISAYVWSLFGSATRREKTKDLKNIGPSLQYRLRDASGQAREFDVLMLPVQLAGDRVFLAGVRDKPDQPFHYLRIPADDHASLNEWMRLRAALQDAQLREQAARRYAQQAIPLAASSIAADDSDRMTLRLQLGASAHQSLNLFAQGGYRAVSTFLETLPQEEQQKAADIVMKVLHGSCWTLWQLARHQAGLPKVSSDTMTAFQARFFPLAINALSDATFYQAPVLLMLKDFDEVKASVFQVTRSPGKPVVYVGCVFLVCGLLCMLYVPQRRLWVWICPSPAHKGSTVLMAMSTQRKTLHFKEAYQAMSRYLQNASASNQ